MNFQGIGVFLVVCAWFNSSIAQESTSPAPLRNSQALIILERAVQAAGGLQAISTLRSYSASGRVTFYWTEEGSEGNVTMKGRSPGDFRMDARFADGTDQWVTVKKGAGFKKELDGTQRPLHYQEVVNLQSFCFPQEQLARALRNPTTEIDFKGTAMREGRQALGVRIKTVASPSVSKDLRSRLSEKTFYVDANTFEIVSIEDSSYPENRIADGVHRKVTFSDYRKVNGVLFPFSIDEQFGKGRRVTAIRLSEVLVNVGLSDRDFEP